MMTKLHAEYNSGLFEDVKEKIFMFSYLQPST